jgi:hypothetical protein
MICTYDWRIEFIQVLPFGLAGRHHVDFGVFKGPTVPHLGHDLLRVGAKRAVLADEQSVSQTPLLTQDSRYSHIGDGSGDADSIV